MKINLLPSDSIFVAPLIAEPASAAIIGGEFIALEGGPWHVAVIL